MHPARTRRIRSHPLTGVLVDTSVWVAHFRQSNSLLAELLEHGLALTHPMVLGELACGTPPARKQTLADLDSLQKIRQASFAEAMALVERERLFGLGCGIVDIMLLASTLITPGVDLWTLDKRLACLAGRFGVMHQSSFH